MTAIIDYRGKSPNKTTFGVPLITAKVVKGGRIETPDEFIAEVDYEEWMSRGIPQAGDVVMTTEAPLGEVAQLDGRKVALAQRIITLRGKPGLLDQSFLKFLLQSKSVQEELRSRATGTTVVGIKQSELRKVNLTLPPYESQKCIGHILGTLDDKIELNRRMNETLEAMARAIFQSWFVDFDPVRAKASGESTDSICQRLGLTPELLALFPDSFEDSELGAIPEGWNPKVFSETIQIIGGGTPKTSVEDFWGGDIPWFSVVDAPTDSDVFVIDTEKKITNKGLESSSTKLLPAGVTIISARGTVGKVALVGTPMAMNQSCYGLRGRNSCDVYTYYATRQLVSSLKRHGHGAVFDTITRDTFASVKVVSCDAISKAFDAMVAPNMKRIKANAFHTARLVELRDSLLPKLLTGELSPMER